MNDELRGGKNYEILIELAAQLGADTVCGVALTSTTGLAQRAGIANLRRSLQVPVGDQFMFDRLRMLPASSRRRPRFSIW